MLCKICNSLSNFVFQKKLLQKYEVSYFRCTNCGFLHTEEPYWLEEAYKLPFTPLDVYLASRPMELSQLTENLILNYFNPSAKFLDYGGGIGVFTRMMRDRGLQFYRQDKYAQNLFAQYFDINDLPECEQNFELATAFEVLEHLPNPLSEISQLFTLSSNVFCSTVLQPDSSLQELQSWHYLAELHGQHIAFYTLESLKIIAKKFNCYYYSNGFNLHLFTSRQIENFTFDPIKNVHSPLPNKIKNKLIYWIEAVYRKVYGEAEKPQRLQSLIQQDTEWVTKQLQQQKAN
jgi:2-polyprenyl-3-methyl-5-hydroxy-6-metoxy-1,4-benzoquinol methylase